MNPRDEVELAREVVKDFHGYVEREWQARARENGWFPPPMLRLPIAPYGSELTISLSGRMSDDDWNALEALLAALRPVLTALATDEDAL